MKTREEMQAASDRSVLIPSIAPVGDIGKSFPATQVPQQTDHGTDGIDGGGIGENKMKTAEQAEAEKAKKTVSP